MEKQRPKTAYPTISSSKRSRLAVPIGLCPHSMLIYGLHPMIKPMAGVYSLQQPIETGKQAFASCYGFCKSFSMESTHIAYVYVNVCLSRRS